MQHRGLDHDIELQFGAAAEQACLDIAQEVVDELQSSPNTPVRTGKMKRGFHARRHNGGAVVANPEGWYWKFVEYGHDEVTSSGEVVGHVHAQPFVRPAWETVRSMHAS